MKTRKIFQIGILLLSLFAAESIKAEDRLRERIYVQTDKQIYVAGEQLWLKIYLTDAQGKPQTLSKIGYVELIDDDGPHIQQKIEIENGTGAGMIMLPTQLSTGYYRLVAYTRYMQNEGETVYFQKYIGVVNTLSLHNRIKTDTTLLVTPPPTNRDNLTVSSLQGIYSPRMQSEIRIEGLPDNVHSLAVSIAGEEFIPVPDEEETITSWQQRLSAIETKNFQLDLLPEYEGPILSGQLVDAQTGVPKNNILGIILGVSDDVLRVSGGEVNKEGQVRFHLGPVSNRRRLGIAFLSAQEERYYVKWQSPFAAHTTGSLPIFALNPAWEAQLVQRSVGVQVMYSFLLDSLIYQAKVSGPHIRWKPDYSYILDEYTRFDRMNVMFTEFIPSLVFRMVGGQRELYVRTADHSIPSGKSLLLLDGIPVTDADFLFNLNTRLLKRVDVYRGRFFFAGHVFEGIGSFISVDNNAPGLRSGSFLQLEDYEGTQPGYRFYAPSYQGDHSPYERRRIPDYRHTLLWNPDVQTNGQHTIAIPFSTSDITGNYRLVVEGITSDGQPLRGVARFQVNN